MAVKILVTGSNGQLGKCFRELSAMFPKFDFIFTAKEELQIELESVVQYFFEKYQPDYCINCAAYTAVDKAEEARSICYSANVTGPKNLAETALQYNCKLIHISTDYVFDGQQNTPYVETDTPHPVNYYGLTKLEGEQQVLFTNPKSIILRTSWVYSIYGSNFVKTMLQLMQTRDHIRVVDDQTGAPTYAPSLANAILQMIQQLEVGSTDYSGIYHYSGNAAISWYTFAKEIKKISKSNCEIQPIPTADYPTAAKRSAYSVLDHTKISGDFQLSFKTWQEELQECIHLLQHPI